MAINTVLLFVDLHQGIEIFFEKEGATEEWRTDFENRLKQRVKLLSHLMGTTKVIFCERWCPSRVCFDRRCEG